ncbi:hypothetical protein QUB56_36195, partial [Microcoleus sp. AR_TQ3_B6]
RPSKKDGRDAHPTFKSGSYLILIPKWYSSRQNCYGKSPSGVENFIYFDCFVQHSVQDIVSTLIFFNSTSIT